MTERGGLSDVTGVSADHNDSYTLRLHFRRAVTDQDRRDLLEAINLKITAALGEGEEKEE
jgi:hypothetical protein